jgi:hypothetical protein
MSLLFVVSVFGIASTMAAYNPPPEPEYCNLEYYTISSNSVKVGQTFTISLKTTALGDVKIQGKTVEEITLAIASNGGLPFKIGPVELIDVDYMGAYSSGEHIGETWTYNGFVFPPLPPELDLPSFVHWSDLTPKEWEDVTQITWTFRAVTPGTLVVTNETCNDTETVTITSKDLPFKFFAKLFGFGKKD